MTILITRPEPAASRTRQALAARGLDALITPLFTIVPTGVKRPKGKFAALLVTSANGAAGLTPAGADLAADMPVFAVGDRTAEVLRANGFSKVTSAAGDGKALAALVLSGLKPRGRVVLATGDDHKEALPQALSDAGHDVALWTRYRAQAVEALPDEAVAALQAGRLTGVLHYSRRASETFVDLAKKAGVTDAAASLRHLALSEDVAEPLLLAGFSSVEVAAQPDESALFDVVAAAVTVAPARAASDATFDIAPVAGAALSEPVTALAEPVRERSTGLPGVTLRSLPADASAEPVSAAPEPMLVSVPPPAELADAASTVREVVPAAEGAAQPLAGEPATVTAASAAPGEEPATTTSHAAAGTEPVAGMTMAETPMQPAADTPTPAPEPPMAPEPAVTAAAPSAVAPPAPPPARGIGAGGLIGVALAGGLLGATGITFLAPVLNQAGIRFPNSPTLAATDARLTRLEQAAPAAPAATPMPDLAPLQSGLAATQERIGAITRQIEGAQAEIGRLSAAIAALPASSVPGAPAAAVEGLRQELSQRLASAEAALGAVQALAPRVAGAEAAAQALVPRLAGVEAAAQALGPRVAQAERLSQRAAQAGSPVSAAARIVMAERVQRALAEGRPFAQEASALTALGAGAEPMRALTALAAAGAPALSALTAEIRALRQTTARQLTQEGPIADRMLAMLDGVVRVRAQGEPAGEGVLPVFDRIEQALARGDAGAALGAFAALPEPVRLAAEAFRARLAGRAAADQAARSIMDDATKALAGAS